MTYTIVHRPYTMSHYGRCPFCRFMASLEEYQKTQSFNCGTHTAYGSWFRSDTYFEIERLKRHRTKLRKLLREARRELKENPNA